MLSSEYCKSFGGKVFPVNPNADSILGVKCYPSVKDVPESIDLAVIAVPAKIVPSVLKECGKKKVPFAVIISAGFAETGKEGEKLQEEILKIAKSSNMRLVGPNCLGIIRTYANMNASFAPTMPPEGPVGFISQSGALADSIIDWAVEQKYGLSVSDSLLNMLQRVESMDLRYFVSAVLIQQETGGNLAELMENIAHVVRSRLNFKAKVRGLTATGRFSATIMIIVPVLAFFGLLVVAPHYERILFTSSVGRMMLLSGMMAILVGAFLLRKLVRSVET